MQADMECQLEALAERYYAVGDGTRKASTYLREYEALLRQRRTAPLRLLELGVSSGASVLIWRDYLPNATIVGLDLAAAPSSIRDQPRIHFIQGSQDDPEILDRAGEIAGGRFDLIIDDASHLGYLTKRSFQYLFPRWLVPGGVYAIEDYGTGFMPEYPDGAAFVEPPQGDSVPETQVFASHQYGMVGVLKQLMDHLMTELMTGQPPRYDIERMTILSNIALVQKAGGVPMQGAASVPAPGAGADRALDQVPLMAAEMRRQGERIAALDSAMRELVEQLRRNAERSILPWRR
ncbi:MAG TPA: class I SAM-dependent methyltransferase [Acetobacteraceae bacterium]|nr:class I SAM-dependent methyltransferase [Acetobacteraceae bacterium]